MSRTKLEQFSKEERQKLLKKFFTAIAVLGSYNEVTDFFKDLLNSDEMAMLARRLKIAQLLEQGLTYDEIAAKMHVGYDTIAKVNYWLKYGSGGYKEAVRRLNKVEKGLESKRIRKAKESQLFTLAWLRKKYHLITEDDLKDMIDDFNDFIKKIKRNKSLYKG